MSCCTPLELLKNKINELYEKADYVYGQIFPRPQVKVCDIGRRAGLACLNHNWIKLNKTLFYENVDAFLNDTVIHEVAHLIAYKLFPDVNPHGPVWRSVMKNLGGQIINIEHSYDTTNCKKRKYTKFVYSCKCGKTHLLGKTRHKRFQNGIIYACNECKVLTYTGEAI